MKYDDNKMAAPSPAKIAMALVSAIAAFAYLGGLAWSTAKPEGTGAVAVFRGAPAGMPVPAPIAALKPLGARLLDPGPGGFLVPFELISALLLAALVGAIAVARGGRSAGGGRIGQSSPVPQPILTGEGGPGSRDPGGPR